MSISPEARKLGAKISAQRSRAKALASYYQSPNTCLKCGVVIRVGENEKPWDTRRKKFCGRSCANSYSNTHSKKIKRTKKCLSCGQFILASKKYCSDECRQMNRNSLGHINRSIYVISWRKRTKLRAIEYLGGRCQICGYGKSTRALVFHHKNPSEKDFSISRVSKSWSTIQAELDKCILLCANCHAEAHEGLLDLSRF